MDKIISLDDKIKLTSRQKAAIVHKRKLAAVRKVFQCAGCAAKCERCGGSIEPDQPGREEHPRIPYRFCRNCAEDYRDYIEVLQGKRDPEAFWQNHAWLKVWQSWIEYQGALDNYVRSKEFRRLLAGIDPDPEIG